MKIDQAVLRTKAQGLKGKAKKARAEGKVAVAKAFKKGARKIVRKLKKLPKPTAKAGEAKAEAAS